MKEREKIQALGKIEGYKHTVDRISAHLEGMSLWEPAAQLKRECHEVRQRMEGLSARFDRKLVITIIGPGGAGKSTLLNAIGGRDNLSASGNRRPTTEKAIALCQEPQDVDDLIADIGENNIEIVIDAGNQILGHCILLDMPDTDSNARENHVPLVRSAIKKADILLCIFNAENPKNKDHVDFYAEYIPYFQGSALIGILNKCDRIEEAELRKAILPEFEQYIHQAWGRPLASLFCISARRHLQQPEWDNNAQPRHNFDQYEDLLHLVSQTLNHPAYRPEKRVGRARHLCGFIQDDVRAIAEKHVSPLKEARELAIAADRSALQNAFETIGKEGSGQVLGVNVLLYQRLANQWFGPIGWMIAIWARILIFGTGLMAMLRFGNPIRQVLGVISSLRHFKDTQADIDDAQKDERVHTAMQAYRVTVLQKWPDIAEKMVQGGFQSTVRRVEDIMPQQQRLSAAMSELWQQSLNATLDQKSKIFSNFMLQILFNLPVLVLLGHIGWLTSKHYFLGDYLSSDFFLHAFITAVIILFLSFFLFQGSLRLFSSPGNIVRRSFINIQQQMDPLLQFSKNPLFRQLEMVIELGEDRKLEP